MPDPPQKRSDANPAQPGARPRKDGRPRQAVPLETIGHAKTSIESYVSHAGRVLLGWTQRDLADKAGVAREVITDWESGKRQPRHTSIAAIREALENGGIQFLAESTRLGPGVTVLRRVPHSHATGAQVMAGRALLEMTQQELARASGLSSAAVSGFERGSRSTNLTSVECIERELSRAGVSFVGLGGKGREGVRLARRRRA